MVIPNSDYPKSLRCCLRAAISFLVGAGGFVSAKKCVAIIARKGHTFMLVEHSPRAFVGEVSRCQASNRQGGGNGGRETTQNAITRFRTPGY
jgi:hypothetical protein